MIQLQFYVVKLVIISTHKKNVKRKIPNIIVVYFRMTSSFVKGCLDVHVCIYSLTEARELQFFIECVFKVSYNYGIFSLCFCSSQVFCLIMHTIHVLADVLVLHGSISKMSARRKLESQNFMILEKSGFIFWLYLFLSIRTLPLSFCHHF